jgi:hypothetical protein
MGFVVSFGANILGSSSHTVARFRKPDAAEKPVRLHSSREEARAANASGSTASNTRRNLAESEEAPRFSAYRTRKPSTILLRLSNL